MTFDEFTSAIAQGKACPNDLPPALQGLWIDKQGNWDKAHRIVQNAPDADSAWVHAYLHREEGDIGNANYWYRRAGKSKSNATLAEEWEEIAKSLLANVPTTV